MKRQIAALSLHHPHTTNGAVQAFHTFGVWSHHGSGEAVFWLVIAGLVLLLIASKAFGRTSASH